MLPSTPNHRPRRDWIRGGLLLAGLLLYLVPWLRFSGKAYSGFTFRDLGAAVTTAAGVPSVTPITWDLIFLQPAATVGALLLLWQRRAVKAADFLAAFALFVGPLALAMVKLETADATLLPGGYVVIVLAVMAVALDFRPGLERPGSHDGSG